MRIEKEDARAVIGLIRQARERYARIAGDANCDKARLIFRALDVAELQVADEVTNDYQEPRMVATLRNIVRALGLWKDALMDRVDTHSDAFDVLSR